jgi:hypothetical protein
MKYDLYPRVPAYRRDCPKDDDEFFVNGKRLVAFSLGAGSIQ